MDREQEEADARTAASAVKALFALTEARTYGDILQICVNMRKANSLGRSSWGLHGDSLCSRQQGFRMSSLVAALTGDM